MARADLSLSVRVEPRTRGHQGHDHGVTFDAVVPVQPLKSGLGPGLEVNDDPSPGLAVRRPGDHGGDGPTQSRRPRQSLPAATAASGRAPGPGSRCERAGRARPTIADASRSANRRRSASSDRPRAAVSVPAFADRIRGAVDLAER